MDKVNPIEARIQSDADHTTWKVIHGYFTSGRYSMIAVVQPGFSLGEVGSFLTSEENGESELEVFLATGAMKYAVPDESISKIKERKAHWGNYVLPFSSFGSEDSLMVVAIPPCYLIQRYADYDKRRK